MYMQPASMYRPLPQQGGNTAMTSAMQGLQLGKAIGGIWNDAKAAREARERERNLNRELTRIAVPGYKFTKGDWLKVREFGGIQTANAVANMHRAFSQMKREDQNHAYTMLQRGADYLGGIMDGVRRGQTPEERMGIFNQMIGPLMDDPNLRDMAAPMLSLFKNGDFSDEAIARATVLAKNLGLYAKNAEAAADRAHRENVVRLQGKNAVDLQNARNTGAADVATIRGKSARDVANIRKAIAEIEGKSREAVATIRGKSAIEVARIRAQHRQRVLRGLPSGQRRQVAAAAKLGYQQQYALAGEMVKKHGGDLASWMLFIRGTYKGLVKETGEDGWTETWVVAGTGKKMDLGSAAKTQLPQNDRLATDRAGDNPIIPRQGAR